MAEVIRPPEEGVEALEEREFFPAGASAAAIGGLAVGTPPAANLRRLRGGRGALGREPAPAHGGDVHREQGCPPGHGHPCAARPVLLRGPAHLRNEPAHGQPGHLQPPAQLRSPARHRRRGLRRARPANGRRSELDRDRAGGRLLCGDIRDALRSGLGRRRRAGRHRDDAHRRCPLLTARPFSSSSFWPPYSARTCRS